MGNNASSKSYTEFHYPIEPMQFEGEASTEVPFYLKHLPRTNSVEIHNDPRIVQQSVITKRFGAFQAISVGATLMASLALTTAVGLESMENNWCIELSLALMLLVFAMNILAVLVITQQNYQIHRLETSMSHGFEIAKSYYLNDNITRLRHYATQSFFAALPIYVLAVALSGFAKMKLSRPVSGAVILGVLSVCALILVAIIFKQKDIFNDHRERSMRYARPLMSHMDTVRSRHDDSDVLLG